MMIDHVFSWVFIICFPVMVLSSFDVQMFWDYDFWVSGFWIVQLFLLRHSCYLIPRDEEYDSGKRKKVRKSMRGFSGPNPFQEVENIRSRQRRRLQAGQARSGHQPLRIWYCRSRSLLYPSFLQLGFLFLCFFYFLVCVIEELGQIRSMDLS